jgi:TRAP-type C4-dicarboxylate transport system permease small subunit
VTEHPTTDRAELVHARLSRAWWIVTAACVVAFAGCLAATGAALVITNALTWHSMVTTGLALAWLGGALLSGVHARRLGRQARDTTAVLAQAGSL